MRILILESQAPYCIIVSHFSDGGKDYCYLTIHFWTTHAILC